MSRPVPPPHAPMPSALRPPWRRPRQRTTVTLLAGLLAVMTVGQGLAADRPQEGEGARMGTTSETMTAAEDTVEPLAPPQLPQGAPIEVDQPQQQTQVEQQPAPSATPNQTLANLDLSPVEAKRPKIRLAPGDSTPTDPVGEALAVEGVTFATSVDLAEMPITSEEGTEPVRVAAVDPNGFRVLTPQVTADAVDVWKRIAEGDAAFTHDVGTRLSLELGSRVPAGHSQSTTVRVGAYASNGIPPVADVIISKETAEALGLRGVQSILVSIADGVDVERVAEQLRAATGMDAEVIAEPETRRAFLTGAAARDAFEPFSYVSIGDGMIQIDRDWVSRNIVSAQVPIFRGNVICHRQMIPQLRGALQEIVDSGLDHLIDPSQYGGCWVPRHILFNPSRALSMHAWGLAIDFNVKGNEYGNRNPEMDPRIVEIFDKWGFVWGGRWSTPDGMHFELGALLDS